MNEPQFISEADRWEQWEHLRSVLYVVYWVRRCGGDAAFARFARNVEAGTIPQVGVRYRRLKNGSLRKRRA